MSDLIPKWDAEWQTKESELQERRDFGGLIKLYTSFLKKLGHYEPGIKVIPPLIYCYLRIGKFKKAKKLLKDFKAISWILDEDSIYRVKALLHLVKTKNEDGFGEEILLRTLRSWITHPDFQNDVKWVVFDFEDYIGKVLVQLDNIRETKNDKFPDELLGMIFFVMCSSREIVFYYNRHLNIVQQEVEGYLVNSMEENQEWVNSNLRERILSEEPADHIIFNVHFEIPKLYYNGFINYLLENISDLVTANFLLMFLSYYEQRLLHEHKGIIESVDDLLFTSKVMNKFIEYLEDQFTQWGVDLGPISKIISEAPLDFGLMYLRRVNNHN